MTYLGLVMNPYSNKKIVFFIPDSSLLSGGTLYNLLLYKYFKSLGIDIALIQCNDNYSHTSMNFNKNENAILLIDAFLLDKFCFKSDARDKIIMIHGPHLPRKKLLDQLTFKHIVFASHSLKQKFINSYPCVESEISVINPGTDHFPIETRNPSQPHSMATVGALSTDKDQALLIDGLSVLGHLDWHLHIIGSKTRDINYARYIRKKIKKHKLSSRVTLHGELEHTEIVKILKKTQLYIVSSQYESFGISAFEALNSAIPVLNCSEGFLREAIGEKQGWQIKGRCPLVLARFMSSWLKGKIPLFEPSLIHFPWSKTYKSYLRIIENI